MSTPEPTSPGAPGTSARPTQSRSLATVLGLYTLARIALLAGIAGLLVLAGAPLILAVLVGLIVALPLSMLVFKGLRAQLDTALEVTRRRRTREREALRAQLRGVPDASDDGPEPQPESGGRGPEQQEQPGVAEHPDQATPLGAAEHPPGLHHGKGQRHHGEQHGPAA
jgi:Protein of unknown function (DUF4229)